MGACYGQNCILIGTVDFYCLLCETYLRNESDSIVHIAKPIHKKNLDSTQYVKGFEEDFVRKINQGYFCELCNKLLPMMARVKLHIKEPPHVDSKNKKLFKRIGCNVIAFGKVVINDSAWNGLTDESCAFCNTEYKDEKIHKNLMSHILNIIQIKVDVDENRNLYRKIDEVSFQCLTCNMVLALNNISCHFEDGQHKHRYQECCAAVQDIKELDFKKAVENMSHQMNDSLSTNVTKENADRVHVGRCSDGEVKCDAKTATTTVSLTKTNAIDAISSITVCEDDKDSKNAMGSAVKQLFGDPKDDSQTTNKTAENKEEALKNADVKNKKTIKNKKGKKTTGLTDTKKSETSDVTSKTIGGKTSYNIGKYEEKICKILKTENYITLDENGKTLCILCDWLMDPKNKKIHITGQHHQTLEKLHKRRLAKTVNKKSKEGVLQSESIVDLVGKFQENNININLISNSAVCKKCTVSLPYDVKAIEEHILKHDESYERENNVTTQSCEAKDKDKETCENISKETIKEDEDRIAVENDNKEKIESVEDKNDKVTTIQPVVDVEEKKNNKNDLKDEAQDLNDLIEKSVLKRKSLGNYIKSLSGIKHMIFNDAIINEEICISAMNFNFLFSKKGEFKCLVCEENVDDVESHINIFKHITLLNEKPVIIIKSEFVREIHPDMFHCGFCNITTPSWKLMKEHFDNSDHKDVKIAAAWRLKNYKCQVEIDQYKKSLSDQEFLRNMLCGLF